MNDDAAALRLMHRGREPLDGQAGRGTWPCGGIARKVTA